MNFFCFLLFWGVFFSVVGANPREKLPTRLGRGDKVWVFSETHQKVRWVLQIDASGRVEIPKVGPYQMAGKTPRRVIVELKRLLRGYYRRIHSLRIQRVEQYKYVHVVGWVKKPGRYLLPFRATLDALLQKVEPLYGARLNRIWIQPSQGAPQLFDYYAFLQERKQKAPFLQRDSLVYVSSHSLETPKQSKQNESILRHRNYVSVQGGVESPGLYRLLFPQNLLQLIALSKGFSLDSNVRKILYSTPSGKILRYDMVQQIENNKKVPLIHPGCFVFVTFQILGGGGKNTTQLAGYFNKPGLWGDLEVKDYLDLISQGNGPLGDADLTRVSVTFTGRNFTIQQTINHEKSLKEGRLDLLPPTPKGQMIVEYEKLEVRDPNVVRSDAVLKNVLTGLSIVTGLATIVITVISLSPRQQVVQALKSKK